MRGVSMSTRAEISSKLGELYDSDILSIAPQKTAAKSDNSRHKQQRPREKWNFYKLLFREFYTWISALKKHKDNPRRRQTEISSSGMESALCEAVVQRQTTATAYFSSQQLLLFAFFKGKQQQLLT